MRYVVQPGDTLLGIARQFGVELEDLRSENPMIRPPMRPDKVLYPGEIINVPVGPPLPPPPAPPPPPTVIEYIIQPGDTLYAVSRRFNLPVGVIVARNPHLLGRPELIFPGEIIYVDYTGRV